MGPSIVHAGTRRKKREPTAQILLLAGLENLLRCRGIGGCFISLGNFAPIGSLVVHEGIVAFFLEDFGMQVALSRLHASHNVGVLEAPRFNSCPDITHKFGAGHVLPALGSLQGCPESFGMVDNDQGATIHHRLPVGQFDVFHRLVHHRGHFASRVANRPVGVESPGEVHLLSLRYLAGEVAIEIVPQFPTVGVKAARRAVIDKEINSGIAGITKFLVRGLLQQFLAEGMIEPHGTGVGGMLDPVDILSASAEKRHPVVPLRILQETRASRQITQFFLLRGPLAGKHVPALHTKQRPGASTRLRVSGLDGRAEYEHPHQEERTEQPHEIYFFDPDSACPGIARTNFVKNCITSLFFVLLRVCKSSARSPIPSSLYFPITFSPCAGS